MAQPAKIEESRNGARWLALSLGVFALIALGLFGAATVVDRAATLEKGWTDAENTAALLAAHTERALRVAEISTARIAAMVEAIGFADPRADTILGRLAAEAPEINALELLDTTGRVLASNLPNRQEAADPPVDAMMALQAGAKSHLSALGFERPGQMQGFTWSRALREGETLVGVAGATLHAEFFGGAATGLALGPDPWLALLRDDGALVMRWPAEGGTTAEAPRPRPFGRQEETGADGITRLVAWHGASGMPVTAVAGLSRDHVLRPFRQRLFRNGVLFGLSAALAGAVGAAALAAARRAEAARRAAQERGDALVAALAGREELLGSVREGEARLRLAEQAGGVGLWDWDLRDGQLMLFGDVFAQWGLGQQRRMGAALVMRGVLTEDRPTLAAALAAAVRGEVSLEVDFRLAGLGRLAPGRPRWIALRAELRRDALGEPRRLLGTALDITTQREQAAALVEANAMLERRVAGRTGALAEANARLREGEARFRGIFDATFQIIALLSPDGTVLEANAALREPAAILTPGGPAAEPAPVLGQPYWEAPCWPADGSATAALRHAVARAAEGRFVRRELLLTGPAGQTRAIDVSVKPLRDEDGIVSLLVAEGRDVSELKAAQAQLLEAQKMETLGQLTGGVAHDFNNLLMAVLGNLALARRRLGPAAAPEVQRHLDAAVLGAERGAQVTQRLLAFARRQDLRPAPVDLEALLAGMTDLLRRSAGPLAAVSIEAAPNLPPALVDAHALELALMNLAVNARDAMPEGGQLLIRVDAVQIAGKGAAPAALMMQPAIQPPARLPAGRYLRIKVADTGQGMEPATLARAVEPFFTTKGPGQGTGLGLSMVHGLAHQSGGALTLHSAPGAGMLAVLWLPVSDRPAAPLRALVEAEPASGSGAVLVVDDEPLVLESTAAMLEALGYLPVTASSGAAALATLEARPDLVAVVTDFAMPGMTGLTLAERIAARRPGLPVVIASGQPAGPQEAPYGRLGKPYSLAQLATALEALVPRQAAE